MSETVLDEWQLALEQKKKELEALEHVPNFANLMVYFCLNWIKQGFQLFLGIFHESFIFD